METGAGVGKTDHKSLLGKGPGMHRVARSLYLKVTDSEAGTRWRSWVFRYTYIDSRDSKKKQRWMGLGSFPEFTLKDVRDGRKPRASDPPDYAPWTAKRCRELLQAGHDPFDERDREQKARSAVGARIPTFAEAVAEFLPLNSKRLSNTKNAAQWKTTLTEDAAALGPLPVNEITTRDVIACLAKSWVTKNETCRRVLGRVRKVLDWARVSYPKVQFPQENPARNSVDIFSTLRTQFPETDKKQKRKGHAALPWARMGSFVADLRKQKGAAARCLELAILTASRTSEVIGARWDEFDLDAAHWRVPAARMKSKLLHTVPLTPAVVTLLEAQRGLDDVFVFPGTSAGSHLSNGAMLELVKDMHATLKKVDNVGYVDPKQGGRRITPHGFRSAFKDWARVKATAYVDEVSELCLAHVDSDDTRAAYARDELLEDRARLLADWAVFCGMNTSPKAGNVTPINTKTAA